MMRNHLTTLFACLWLLLATVVRAKDTTPTLTLVPELREFHQVAGQLQAAYAAGTTETMTQSLIRLAFLNSEITTKTEDLGLRMMARAEVLGIPENEIGPFLERTAELIYNATSTRAQVIFEASQFYTSGDATLLTTATETLALCREHDLAMAEHVEPYASRVLNVTLPAIVIPIFDNAFAGLSGQIIAVPVRLYNFGTQPATGVKLSLFRDDRKRKNNTEIVEIGTVPARTEIEHVFFLKLDRASRVVSLTVTVTSTNAGDLVNQTTILVDDVE